MGVGVFDLGGVLYEFAGRQVLKQSTTLPELSDRDLGEWPSLPFVNAFETGRGTIHEFATGVVDQFKLAISPDEFVQRFELAAQGFYHGALDLVDESRFEIKVTLSNTNELHWPRVLADLGQSDPFDSHFPSHLIGHHKPATAAFEYVMSQFQGEDFVFFDDRSENVEAARQAGMKSYRVVGVQELKAALLDAEMISVGRDSA